MSRYAITPDGVSALEVFDDPTVRFAASLDNGQGFVAFDGDLADLYRISSLTGGRMLSVYEPDSFFPFCPKRHIGTGLEVFSLLPTVPGTALAGAQRIRQAFPGALVAIVTGNAAIGDGDPYVLVETQGVPIPGSTWSGVVTEFMDKRILVDA